MTTITVIKCWGIAGPFACSHVGQFLVTSDFEADEGRGHTTWTPDLTKAMRFRSKIAATKYWRTQSKTVPLRPDGKPNRPLTAFHVVIEDITFGEAGKTKWNLE